ncbi:MAG TPA: hypothetical protein QGH10_13810, partial [Armatimonadota bacterium]|nr:hypothetical protein [Armatimonadota bacterium]
QVRFNVTSADWDTGEYTSLARVSSWHDPHQLGVARLGERRVDVASLDMGRVGLGSCVMRAGVTDVSGEAADYKIQLDLSTTQGKTSVESAFSLSPNGRESLRLGFDVRAVEGAWEANVRIVDAEGRPVYAARRMGTVLPPLTVRLKSSAAFADGADVTVAANVGLGDITTRRVTLVAKLLDSRGRVVGEQDLGKPEGADLSARLPVARLSPGTYRLRLEAVQDDETIASAEDSLRVGASPFAGQ